MPGVLVFDQAVTLPVVWITAHYCFVQAQHQAMHDVLVHAASGGVGLVSVEWVTRARATAHATAGAISKHALLRLCEVLRLSSSRDAAACANLLSCILRGRRLHSLLNALSNDFVSLSLATLAPRGVFLEVGKNGIWSQDRSLAAMPFVDYVAVAVDDGCRSCPGWNKDPWWVNSELLQLSTRARAGEVQPLLFEGFAFEERAVQAALRLLQRGANMGKVVVRVGMLEPMVEEQREPSLEVHLKGRGQERGTDLGTLVGLRIDGEGVVAVVELHDPQVSCHTA
jgi:NADPH:quinone reductase-like Zn-dependent oxidoreductase